MLTIFSTGGIEIAMTSNRTRTIIYLIALCVMFGTNLYTYFSSKGLGLSIQDNLNEYWGTFSTTTRSMIQDFVSLGAAAVMGVEGVDD